MLLKALARLIGTRLRTSPHVGSAHRTSREPDRQPHRSPFILSGSPNTSHPPPPVLKEKESVDPKVRRSHSVADITESNR
jgi:hypothetical protein